MYIFKIGNYETPSLCAETERLLCKRLETCSRKILPKVWKLTDAANAYAANGPRREKRAVRYRVYGGIFLALGIFVLVPGLLEPQNPVLIFTGALALLAGAAEFALAGKRRASPMPQSCQKEAKKLIEKLRAADFEKNPVEINFDDCGMAICADGDEQKVSYEKMKAVFEEEHLWLLIYDNEKALLLQKCDLASGDADKFTAFIRSKISADAL